MFNKVNNQTKGDSEEYACDNHNSMGLAPRHMPFMLIISALLTSRFASAIASGVGLLAAQSFHNGDDGRGFGAPVAVGRLFVIILKG